MKLTFTETHKAPPEQPCDRCAKQLGVPWYFNWRRRAQVKFLCAACYDTAVEAAAKAMIGNRGGSF